MREWLSEYQAVWHQADAGFLMIFGLFFLILYFLPTLLAIFFNPSHLSKIAVLNIPAGFSLIAWAALLVWACTGKVGEVLRQRIKRNASRNTP